MPDLSSFGVITLFAVAFGAIVLLFRHMEKRRREAFRLVAGRLGFAYQPNPDRQLASRFGFLNALNQGSNHYCSHILVGEIDGLHFMAFEFHYETESTNSKGGRSTDHHYVSVFTFPLPRTCPELTIRPEGLFSKIAQAVGYDDIDFESAEFSRHFCVRSRDRRFAYDVCHPLAIEFLLRHPGLDIEIEGPIVALLQQGSLQPSEVEPALHRLLEFRRLIPKDLLSNT